VDLGRQARIGEVGDRDQRSVERSKLEAESVANRQLAVGRLQRRNTSLAPTRRAGQSVWSEQVDLLAEGSRAIGLVVRFEQ
jgi:hypothetical protein